MLIAGLVIAAGQAGSETSDNVSLPDTGSQNASDLLGGRFPSQAYGSNPIVVATDTGKLTDSKYSERDQVGGEQLEEDTTRASGREPVEHRRRQCTQQGQEDRLHLGVARRRLGRPHRGRGERGARRGRSCQERRPAGRRGRLPRPGAVQAEHRRQRQDRDRGGGDHPAAGVRLGRGDGASHRHRRARPALWPQRHHAARPRHRRPYDGAHRSRP